jgi:ABC-type molybdate transport system permease subunit
MVFRIGIIWLVLAFVLASAARRIGRSYNSFLLLGIILSPLIGFLILFIVGEDKEVLEQRNISAGIIKKCPFCANGIKYEAIVCQFCGRDLPKQNY